MSALIDEALEVALPMCKHFEGLSLSPYLDPVGVPTIGYGTVYKPDGSKVTMSHPDITEQVAEEWLKFTLVNVYMKGVIKVSPNLVSYPEALGAITDFVYNLGLTNYKVSTLKRRIDQQDWEEARSEILRWVYAGGKKLSGLQKRREAERSYLPTWS